MFLAVVVAASASTSLGVLVLLYLATLVVARASRLPFDFFVKRVWLGIPLFAGIVVLPSLFLVPGPRLFEVGARPAAPRALGDPGAWWRGRSSSRASA